MRTNIIIGSVIGVLAAVALGIGLYIHFTKGPPEELFMVRPGLVVDDVQQEVELWPSFDRIIVADESVDMVLATKAVEWWLKQDQPFRFSIGQDPELYRWLETKSELERKNKYLLTIGYTQMTRCGGKTTLRYDKATGEIWTGSVIINKQHTYDERTYLWAMIHEFGHILSLEDDPNPGIDLNSVMRLKLNPGGVLTPRDSKGLRERRLR